jgi:hypothetical protein
VPLPVYLPLWLVRRLPTWWRARRVGAMMRRLDAAETKLKDEDRTMNRAAREFTTLVSDHSKKKH